MLTYRVLNFEEGDIEGSFFRFSIGPQFWDLGWFTGFKLEKISVWKRVAEQNFGSH